MTKAVQEQIFNTVNAGNFRRKQNDNSTISTTDTSSTSRMNIPKKGTAFVEIKEDDDNEEEEALLLPTYEEYLRVNRVIALNIGDTDRVFGGDCVSKLGIGCVQVADAPILTTSKGVLLLTLENGRSPIKNSRVNETVSEDTAGSSGGTTAASNEKPV